MVPIDTDITNSATRVVNKKQLDFDAAAKPRASAASAAALGNTATGFPVSKTRGERYAMRSLLNEVSSLKSPRKCGRVPIGPIVTLKASGDNSSCGYGGLATCGSVWACPVCAGKIAAVRKAEVETCTAKAVKSGAVVSMLTLTQRHHKGQSLRKLWGALSEAWHKVTSGRRWQEFKEQIALIGYIRAVEVTHGKHGWHVHQHLIFLTAEGRDPATTPVFYQRKQGRRRKPYPLEVIMPKDFVAERWKAGLAKNGVDFIANRGGIDWQTVKSVDDVKAVSNYVAKLGGGVGSLAAEATLGQFKKARGENRTPFQIFSDFMTTGDADDLELWHEWEQGSYGKRALIWSKGLRQWAELGREKTDEEIAEEDLGGETVAMFDHDNWKILREIGPAILLDVLESGGRRAAYDWLIDHRIEFSVPTQGETEPDEDA